MKLFKLLDIRQGAQPVLVELEYHDLVMRVETVHVNLPDTILAQVELSELAQLLQVLDLDDLVVGGVEDFELLERAVLESV